MVKRELKATDADKCMMVEAGENISFTLPQTIRPEDDKITFFMRVRKPLTKVGHSAYL